MASLALQIVGTAVGGPIGGAIGGMIGGMLDNVLFPAKQTPPPKITSSTYGDAIPLAYGDTVRLGCNMFWTSGWRKETAGKNAGLSALLGIGVAKAKAAKSNGYEADLAFGVGLGPWQPSWVLKLFANGTCIFDASVATSTPTPDANGIVTWNLSHQAHTNFDTLTVYPGNATQTVDPTIEAALGAGNVPRYKFLAHFVIAGLQGTPFGNSVPLLNVLAAPSPGTTLGEVVNDLTTRCGIDIRTTSTSGLTHQVRGFTVTSQTDGVTALQPLALCYDFDVAEVAGDLRFSPRGQGPLATVINDQLAGHQDGQARPQFEWPRDPELTMPRMAALTFVDPDRDGNLNTQSAQRETGSAQSNLSTRVEVTLTSAEARAVCDRMLWEAQVGRQTLTAASDDRLNWLESGRSYAIETPFSFEEIRITKKSRGANGVLQLEAKRDYPAIYGSTAPSASAAAFGNPLVIGGPVNPPIFVEPASSFPGVVQPTLMIGLSGGDGTTANPAWSGCQVWVSVDDVTGDYSLAGLALGPACMGKLTASLASYGGSNPDTGHVLAVDTSMSGGEPQAISSTDAADALIPYFVGGELLSAQTVVDLGADVFHLGNLWRGLYGTAGGAHAIGAAFLRLDASVFRYPLPAAYVGRQLYFRFVSGGETLASATTYTYTPGGAGFGKGTGGVPLQATVSGVTPAAGGNVVAIAAQALEDNVGDFEILRANGLGASIGTATSIGTVAAAASGPTIYTDATAAPGAAYTYFAVPVNAIGAGTGSAGANATSAPAGGVTSTSESSSFTTTAAFNCYFLDTAGGAITVTLNATPALNELVEIWDATGHAGANPISFAGNGHNIGGSATLASFIAINFGHARLIYDGTQWLLQ